MLIWEWYERRRLALLARNVTGSALDVGFADKPNRYFGSDVRVTGIDLVETAPTLGYERQIVGDFASCDDLDGVTFDYVIAGEVIEHVEDPYGFLRAAFHLLRPGGELRLSTPNAIGFPSIIYEYAQSKHRFYADDHTFYFTPRWMVKMLIASGFTGVTLEPVGLWVPGIPLPWAPISLSYQVVYRSRRPHRSRA